MKHTENHRTAPAAGPAWGADPLGKFIDAAQANAQATFSDDHERYQALADVDGVFRQLIPSVGDAPERLSAVMLMRAHGAFLTAARLALSGQVAEAYALLHGLLRTALQGVFVAGSASRQQLWANRNDDDDARKRMQLVFKSENIRRHFRQIDAATAAICDKLMRRTLDHSAHPNTYADVFRAPSDAAPLRDFTQEYFVHGGEVQRFCLRSAAQVGICCLSMFYYVFPNQYRASDIPDRLNKLRHGH
jgi:hypothetical protein